MKSLRASHYFQSLGEVLAQLQATSATGQSLDLDEAAQLVIRLIDEVRSAGRKVILVGNGGSASIAGHMLMDLSNSGLVRALAFHDYPALTALSNDFGYVTAFERNIKLWGQEGDLLIAISSSGRSENILRAAQAARELGCKVITFSGFASDNPLRSLGLLNFYACSTSYGHVEMAHSVLGHYLTDQIVHR